MFAMLATGFSRYRAALVTGLMLLGASAALAEPESAAPASSPPQSQLSTVGVQKIVVSPSAKKAADAAGKQPSSLDRLADMLDGQMINALQSSGKFNVLSRSDLAKLVEEQSLHGTVNLPGATYLLVIDIDDFQDLTESQTVKGIGTRTTRTVRILPVVKIFDSLGTNALATASMPVTFEITTETPEGKQRNGAVDDRAISEVAQKTAARLVNRVIDVLYPVKVVTRRDKEVTLNRGDTSSLKVGRLWQVRGPDTVETDPDTKAPIRIPGPVLGTVKVTEVQPTRSMAMVVEEAVAGQIVKGSSLSQPKDDQQTIVHLAGDQDLTVPARDNSAASAPAGMKTIGIGQIKIGPTLAKVTAEAGKGRSLDRVAESLAGLFTDRFKETRKFKIIARDDLDAVLKEQHFANSGACDFKDPAVAKILRVNGIQYILVTEINDFLDYTKSKHYQTTTDAVLRTVKVSAIGRLWDTTTGELLESVPVQFEDSVPNGDAPPDHQEGGNLSDKLLLSAVATITNQMANRVTDVLYPLKIIKLSGDQVTLNRGDGTYIAVDQIWQVFKIGEKLTDTDTGASLGFEETPVGTVRITEVKPMVSTADVIAGPRAKEITEGCILRLLQPATGPTVQGAPAVAPAPRQ